MWVSGGSAHVRPVSVRLPHDDVTAVTAVTLDSDLFTGWRLDGAWLTRTDGEGWPMCGERARVGYTYGSPPPQAGVLACVELAVELGRATATTPDKPCQLPKRVQSITRQGISFAALDDMEFLDRGLTGLYTVDLWIKSVNPAGRRQRAQVWSPDLPRAERSRR